jgi:hypothetical protein
VVPKSAILWIIPGADFGTTNRTRKQSLLVSSSIRKFVRRLIQAWRTSESGH